MIRVYNIIGISVSRPPTNQADGYWQAIGGPRVEGRSEACKKQERK
jgi:hypothetical protein